MKKIKPLKLMRLNSDTDEEPVQSLHYNIFKNAFEEMLALHAKLKLNGKPFYSENQIDPELFVSRMEAHWTAELGNIGSEALRATWRQIAECFNNHIRNHDTEDSRKWYALSPPTGSGKTEGTIIYCSMLSKFENYEHPGVMIVTRRIEDAEKIAQRINQFGGRETAIAFHSGKMIKKVKINDLPT
jgi:hypothetical protein